MCDHPINKMSEFMISHKDIDLKEKTEFLWETLPIILDYIKTHAIQGPPGKPGPQGPPCECNCMQEIKDPGYE
jgi:hypothetical protein